MDTRCPQCAQDISIRYLRRYERRGYIITGDQAFACPHCSAPVARNPDPPEANLPFRLTGEVAAFAILGAAFLIAFVLSDLVPIGITILVVAATGTAALALQQWHLYHVTFSSHKVYRLANVREIAPWQPAP